MGDVRAASYGHTLRGAVGLAMVHAGGIGKDGKPMVVEEEKRSEVDEGRSLGSGSGSSGSGGVGGGGSAITTGYRVVNKSFLSTGRWEVEINGQRYPCRVSMQPLYDPHNHRIKG